MSSENKPHLVSVVSELLASAKTENQTDQNHAGGGEFLSKKINQAFTYLVGFTRIIITNKFFSRAFPNIPCSLKEMKLK